MTQIPYSNNPITEAVINLRIGNPREPSAEFFKALEVAFKPNYPQVKRMLISEFELKIGDAPEAKTPSSKQVGLRVTSADNLQIVQAKVDGVSFSRLSPYDKWESFRDEAKSIWKTYSSVVSADVANRLSVRFINCFDLPGPSIELSDYFKIFPEMPDAFNANGMALQIQIDQSDIESRLVVNQMLIPPRKQDFVSVVLDFDLLSEGRWPLTDDTAIWNQFEKLHTRKNEIFEMAITDGARKLIK